MTYLLRVWGRDKDRVVALREPDLRERDDGPLCYWFVTPEERQAFIDTIPRGCSVVRDTHDPGDDGEEVIDTRACTYAIVTLRLADGRVGMFEQQFGYGYPRHSAEFMWREGNYSCDCNKRLFLARQCGIDPHYDEDDADNPCGDTIELIELVVFTKPRP